MKIVQMATAIFRLMMAQPATQMRRIIVAAAAAAEAAVRSRLRPTMANLRRLRLLAASMRMIRWLIPMTATTTWTLLQNAVARVWAKPVSARSACMALVVKLQPLPAPPRRSGGESEQLAILILTLSL